MSRPIDGDRAFRLLTDQLDKETGAYSKGRNAGLNVARSMMNNAQALPTLTLNTLRDAIYEDAVAHGLWEKTDGPIGCSFLVSEEAKELVNAANEAQLARWRFRDDGPEAWVNYVEELADVIIASLSVAGKLGIDIDAAVRRKMVINRARPWKHGKEEQDKP